MTKLTFYDLGLRRRLSLVTEKSNQFWHQLRSSSRSSHVRLDLSLLSLMLLFCLFSQAKFARISTLGEFLELRISISNVLLGGPSSRSGRAPLREAMEEPHWEVRTDSGSVWMRPYSAIAGEHYRRVFHRGLSIEYDLV